jgi:hypothetical protein
VSGKSYDIGLPVDLQEEISKLATLVEANIPEVAHALIRDGLQGLVVARSLSGRDEPTEAKDWWKRVGARSVRTSK